MKITKQIKHFFKNKIKSEKLIKFYYSYVDEKELIKYYFKHKKMKRHAKMYHDLPLENKVVLMNFEGRGYGGNPKYIAKELIVRNKKYDLVWLVKEIDKTMPKKIRQVTWNSEDAYKELATCKVIVNNVKGDIPFKKRKGQYYIETWHSGYGPKYSELEAKNKLPKSYILESKYNSLDSDLFLSNSKVLTELYRRAYMCTCEILEEGLPRNDLFFNSKEIDISRIKRSLNIEEDKKIILYAPTFRGKGETNINYYGLDIDSIKNILENKFGGEWLVATRLHPNIVSNDSISNNYMDLSKYPDMQELLLISDFLITDYSSSIFDMIEMKKPVFIYANDIDEYKKSRGLRDEYFKWGFSIAKSNDELVKDINNFDYDKYLSIVDELNKRFNTFDRGIASKKVVDIIEKKMNDNI